MKIETAKINDSKNIADLIQKNFGKDYELFRIDESRILEKMKDEKNQFIAAKEGEKIIGVVRASIEDLDLAELRWLAVEEECRGKGIGTELIRFALSFLKEKKMRKAVARTKSSDAVATSLFLNLGFEIEGYFRDHFRKGTNIIQFAKFIA